MGGAHKDIRCGSGYPCTVTCSGSESCVYSTIIGNPATDFTIKCSGWEACVNAEISCGSGDCLINCINDGCIGDHDRWDPAFTIGAAKSFQCIGNCPNSLVSKAFSAKPTSLPTQPTTQPTPSPTGIPTNPSLHPSKNPTRVPSSTPSKTPTNPTSDPSTNPTSVPSSTPSKTPFNPTSDPSTNPTNVPSSKPTKTPTTGTANPTEAPTKTPTSPSKAPSKPPTPQVTLPCYGDPDNVCNPGYYDKTNGNSANWACGSGCVGGKYRTDTGCGCACRPLCECGVYSCPTVSPTLAPTSRAPTFPVPTSHPSFPTLKPTRYSPDASALFSMVMTGFYRSDDATLSLILMTKSADYINVNINGMLESPLVPGPESLSELSMYSTCEESSDCTKFWQIDYAQSCGDTDGVFEGDCKVQFDLSCRGQYHEKKQCLDAAETAGVSINNPVSLTTSMASFADGICEDRLYSKLFISEVEANKKYKNGEEVSMKIVVEDEDNEYVVSDVEIRNVFLCPLEESLSNFIYDIDVDVLQQINGIFGCLTVQNYSHAILNEPETIFTVQSTSDEQSTQMRHFTTTIGLNGNAAAVGMIEEIVAMGIGVIVGGLIGSVLICGCCIHLICFCCKKQERKKVSQDEQEMQVVSDSEVNASKGNTLLFGGQNKAKVKAEESDDD
eukprot:446558_1